MDCESASLICLSKKAQLREQKSIERSPKSTRVWGRGVVNYTMQNKQRFSPFKIVEVRLQDLLLLPVDARLEAHGQRTVRKNAFSSLNGETEGHFANGRRSRAPAIAHKKSNRGEE